MQFEMLNVDGSTLRVKEALYLYLESMAINLSNSLVNLTGGNNIQLQST